MHPALVRGVPSRTAGAIACRRQPLDRLAADAVNTSLQQISGGIASIIAGIVVAQGPDGDLQRFDLLGYIVVGTTLLSLGLMYFIQRDVAEISRRS